MQGKLNISEIKKYASDLSNKLAGNYFHKNESIGAKQIADFCNIRQVNLFVLKSLFNKWQDETAKLQSPWFDYQHVEVKNALQQFLNILSRHISLKKNVFQELLTEAIKDTLILALSPHIYFHNVIATPSAARGKQSPDTNRDRNDTLKQLKQLTKYIKINKILVSDLMERIESEQETIFTIETTKKIFNEILEVHKNQLDDPESIIEDFSELSPLSIQKLLSGNFSFSEGLRSPSNRGSTSSVDQAEAISLNKRYRKEQLSLNDSLKPSQSTLHQSHARKAIESLSRAIALNQRHFFINELFNSEYSAYDQAIEKIDLCMNYNEAISLVTENYAVQYNWDMDKKPVEEFIELIERRFQSA